MLHWGIVVTYHIYAGLWGEIQNTAVVKLVKHTQVELKVKKTRLAMKTASEAEKKLTREKRCYQVIILSNNQNVVFPSLNL